MILEAQRAVKQCRSSSEWSVGRFAQMKKYFTFEVQVLDDQNVRRRFRASNYQVSYNWLKYCILNSHMLAEST